VVGEGIDRDRQVEVATPSNVTRRVIGTVIRFAKD
jgi:hypothetical protein